MDDLIERLRANALDECDEAAHRIEELEAKLAKAVEALGTALDEMVDYADAHPSWAEIWDAREAARTTLAELKGQDDER
jgi:hypothetical protein